MAPRQVVSLICKYAARGSRASTLLSRAIEVYPTARPCSRPTLQGMFSKQHKGSGLMNQNLSNIKDAHFMNHRPPSSSVPPRLTQMKDAHFMNHRPPSSSVPPRLTQMKLVHGTSSAEKSVIASLLSEFKKYLEAKFPTDGISPLYRRILKQFTIEVIESFWMTSVQKVAKGIQKAIFWAASGVLFSIGIISGDKATSTDQKFHDSRVVTTRVIEVVSDGVNRISQEQLLYMQKNDAALKELKQEFTTLRVMTELSLAKLLPKKMDVSVLPSLNPEQFLPRLAEQESEEGTKSE